MKPSLLRAFALCQVIAIGLGACAPSPYYTGVKSGLAPGAVPRDGLGRPVLDGKAVEYSLPPPAPALARDIAGRPAVTTARNQIIYFEDLRYSDPPPGRVAANVQDPVQP